MNLFNFYCKNWDKPNLNRALRRTFWHVYDNLGLLLIVTTLWLLLSITIILLPTATTALFYITYMIILDKSVGTKDFFKAMRRYAIKGTIIILTLSLLISLFLINIKICVVNFGKLGILLAAINFWLLLFSLFAFMYIFPLLTRDMKYLKTLKYSYLMPFANIKTTIILAMYSVIFIFLELVVPILGIGILAVFFQNIILEIEARYNPEIKITETKRHLKEIWMVWEH